MADVTLEDLQKVSARLQKHDADIKETIRLHGILDEYATGQFKNVAESIKKVADSVAALSKKVADMEKKVAKIK